MMTHFNSMTAPATSLSAGALRPFNMSASTRMCFFIARFRSVTPQILPQGVPKAAYREDEEVRRSFMTTRMTYMLWPRVLSHWTAIRGRQKSMKRLLWIRARSNSKQASIWSKHVVTFGFTSREVKIYLDRRPKYILNREKVLFGRWF